MAYEREGRLARTMQGRTLFLCSVEDCSPVAEPVAREVKVQC